MQPGMPHKTCKRFDIPGEAHYLTFSCYHRLPLLRSRELCSWLVEALQAARDRDKFDLWGYVFMPEHVHLLVLPTQRAYSVSSMLSAIKRPVAYRAIGHLKRTRSPLLEQLRSEGRAGRVEYHLWQAGGGYDRNLREAQAVHATLDYLHANPVRRGLVEHPGEWYWSSYGEWRGAGGGPLSVDRTVPLLKR